MKPIRNARAHMRVRPVALTVILLSALFALDTAGSQTRRVPDTFTATTADMTPAGVKLRIDVMDWSDDSARATVIATLTAEGDRQKALLELPTVGYVWPGESGVGYALKYAHRASTSDGGERITVVTDRPVGAYDYKPWTAGSGTASSAADYSVIELYLDSEGRGLGTMSLAADVAFDREAQTVSLEKADAVPNVLTEVTREPKPYWATGG